MWHFALQVEVGPATPIPIPSFSLSPIPPVSSLPEEVVDITAPLVTGSGPRKEVSQRGCAGAVVNGARVLMARVCMGVRV
jgi:hypothetical protein